MELRIPHEALVLVVDGRKALILENTGRPDALAFTVVAERQQENPPSRAQGTDKPGRFPDPGPGQRSAVEAPDYHQQAEDAFVRAAVSAFAAEAEARGARALVLVAPPKALAVARASMPAGLNGRVIGDVAKDLTRHPLPEIARVLG